eukprot:jgi/Psemu1/25282/gm1.25282_g
MLTYMSITRAPPVPWSGTARDLAYQTIYDYFAEETATPILLGRLLDLFEPEPVGALGIFLTDTFGKARLRLVHGLRKYPGPLTAPSTNKGKAFGYLDDIEGDAGELVLVDAALLEQAPETLVLSLDRHLDVIKHAHHSHMIPMVLGDDPHMEVITPFKACFIPFQLVPLLLGKGLSPIHALNIIYPYLDTLNLALTCAPLLNTLRAAGTDPTIVDGGVHFATPGTPFRGEPGLTLYMRNQVLYRDLPGLKNRSHPGQPPAPGQPAGVDPTLAATLTALANQQLKLSEGLDQRRPPATVKNTWGPLYTQRLLLLCGKLEEADLPPIYQAWAQKGKHEKTHMIFQSQVATCAAEFLIQAPLVTTAALKKFQDGNFHGTDPFDVADGILPLAFTPPGGSAASLKREQEAAATVAAYDTMISTEGNSLTLKDSLELQKTKAYLPIDWTEATTQLESYLAVLATILGMHHPVVQGYQNGLAKLKLQQMPLRRAIADELGELITPFIVEPASLKKMLQGDATWTTKKVILGWLIDSVNKTISLPPHRVARLHEILHSISPTQRHVPLKQWHQVLGELRSMALAIPGSIGLFSILQEAFRHQEPGRQRLRLTKRVHSFLRDFQWLANDLSHRPTSIAKLVPDTFPATLGACDASGLGMGGVHFVPLPTGTVQPVISSH